MTAQDLRWTIRKAMLIVILLTVVIFVLLPRNPQPIGALFGVAGNGQLEFPSGISLMEPKRLLPSEIQLLSIDWLGPDGKHPANIETLRLRGAILDDYDTMSAQWYSRPSISRRVSTSGGDLFQNFVSTRSMNE